MNNINNTNNNNNNNNNNNTQQLHVNLYIDYVFLDNDERKKLYNKDIIQLMFTYRNYTNIEISLIDKLFS
jgi:hypothetical protein